jgi:hypothetical protein
LSDAQKDIYAPVKLVNHARRYGIEVRKAVTDIVAGPLTIANGGLHRAHRRHA